MLRAGQVSAVLKGHHHAGGKGSRGDLLGFWKLNHFFWDAPRPQEEGMGHVPLTKPVAFPLQLVGIFAGQHFHRSIQTNFILMLFVRGSARVGMGQEGQFIQIFKVCARRHANTGRKKNIKGRCSHSQLITAEDLSPGPVSAQIFHLLFRHPIPQQREGWRYAEVVQQEYTRMPNVLLPLKNVLGRGFHCPKAVPRHPQGLSPTPQHYFLVWQESHQQFPVWPSQGVWNRPAGKKTSCKMENIQRGSYF